MENHEEKTFIKDKSKWIRSIKPGETKKGYFRSYQELDSICTLISRYNRTIGFLRGNKITGSRNWRDNSYTITCINLNEDDKDQNKKSEHNTGTEDC